MSHKKQFNKVCSPIGISHVSSEHYNDKSAISSLPDAWIPQKGGAILKRFLSETKLQHDNLTNLMICRCKDINTDTNLRIKDLAKLLLEQMQKYEQEIRHFLDKTSNDRENVKINNDSWKQISEIYRLHQVEIRDFKKEAMLLEFHRADSFKYLLHDSFHNVIKVGFRTPKDLLHDFDNYLYEINQQLLNNERSYIDMDLYLYSHAAQWYIYARSVLNELTLSSTLNLQQFQRTQSASVTNTSRGLMQRESKSATDLNIGDRDKHTEKQNIWDDFLKNKEVFEKYVSHMLLLYRKAVVKIFSGFSDVFNSLCEDLKYTSLTTIKKQSTFSDLEVTMERVVNKLIRKISEHFPQLKNESTDRLGFQNGLRTLGDKLRETYTMLYETIHLWDSHMLRSGLAQKLTMVAVEDLLTSNDLIQLANDLTFNILLEQLRQNSDMDKLQQQYDALSVQLDQIANVILMHKNSEITKLEEFMKLLPLLTSTILAEIKCFIEKYPRCDTDIKLYIPENELGTKMAFVSTDSDKELLQTELQIRGLLNWRNGFLESFITNIRLVPEELTMRSRQWVDEHASTLHMRYSIKMVSHSVRLERVQAVLNLRRAELQYHEKRLNDHSEAVLQFGSILDKNISTFLDFNNSQLYPVLKWIDEIENRMEQLNNDCIDIEVKKLKMSSYNFRLIKYQKLFEESLIEVLEEIRQHIQHRIQKMRIANFTFLSQIKMFSEGGQYSAVEAGRAMAVLTHCADTIENIQSLAMNNIEQRQLQLINVANQRIAPLLKIIGDFLPKQGRGADKRNVPSKKK